MATDAKQLTRPDVEGMLRWASEVGDTAMVSLCEWALQLESIADVVLPKVEAEAILTAIGVATDEAKRLGHYGDWNQLSIAMSILNRRIGKANG